MRRIITLLVALAACGALTAGCAEVSPPESRTPPPASAPARQMPEVTVTGPIEELNPPTEQQLEGLRTGSVSAAVHTLVLHGYSSVAVVGLDGHELPQSTWDANDVLEVTLDADTALLVID